MYKFLFQIRKKAVDLFKKNHSDQSLDVAKEIEKKIYLGLYRILD